MSVCYSLPSVTFGFLVMFFIKPEKLQNLIFHFVSSQETHCNYGLNLMQIILKPAITVFIKITPTKMLKEHFV